MSDSEQASTEPSKKSELASPPRPLMDRTSDWIGRHLGVFGFIVFFSALFLFNSNHSHANSGDTRSIVDLSWWIAQGHPPTLNGHPNYAGTDEWFGYWAKRMPSGKISVIPAPGTVVFAAPGYAILHALGFPNDKMQSPAQGKVIASVCMAIALTLIWRVLGALHDWLTATVLTTLLIAASPFWSTYSQTLWSQTGAMLAQALSCFLILGPLHRNMMERRPAAAHTLLLLSGFMAGWCFFARPTFVIWPIGFVAFLSLQFRWKSWSGILGVVLAFLAGMAFMHAATDTYFGLHAEKALAEGKPTFSAVQLCKNFIASTFAPFRGLFFYSPWTLLATALGFAAFRKRANWTPWMGMHLLFAMSVFGYLAVFGLLGAWESGPRHAGDILLSLCFIAAPLFSRLVRSRFGLFLVVVLAVPSVYVYSRSTQNLYVHQSMRNLTEEVAYRKWFDWKYSTYRWFIHEGRIERELRGETREPIWNVPRLDMARGDIGKFLISGIMRETDPGPHLQLTHRKANMAFVLPTEVTKRGMNLHVRLLDNKWTTWGLWRDVRFRINGELVHTEHYLTQLAPLDVLFEVPVDRLGQKPYDVLTIEQLDPGVGEYGDLYMILAAISFEQR